MRLRIAPVILGLVCLVATGNATVSPAGVFSDSMVLQRGIPVAVWGWAAVGEQVTIAFNGQSVSATAKDSTLTAYKGYWKAWLQPMPAGGPFDMTITGSASGSPVAIKNILVGDVWICSGQSNMWYTLNGEYATDDAPDMQALPPDGQPINQIRFCRIGPNWSNNPVLDVQKTTQWPEVGGQISAPWRACSRSNAKDFSSVGANFGIAIYKKESVPIGMILAAVGGTSIKQWVCPELSDTIVYRQCGNKPDTVIPTRLPVRLGGGANSETNGALFAGMINALVGFGIKGVIWWQGEEEGCDNHPICYYTSGGFRQLIREWRAKWAQGDFPFIYVQLQQGLWCSTPSGNDVEDQQMQALALPNTGMGICFDSCSGTHPGNRFIPAMRMVTAAREVAYGENIEGMGPIYSGMSIEGASIRVRFAHAGGGLIKKDVMWFEGDNSLAVGAAVLSSAKDTSAPFEIAGADNVYYRADAVIDNNTVVVSSPSVASPKNVKYAREYPLPAKTPLYNANGLPASMFRTETWGGLGTTQTAREDEVRSSSRGEKASVEVFRVVGRRSVVSTGAATQVRIADIYDVRGRRIGQAEVGSNGVQKIDKARVNDQTMLVRLRSSK